MSIFEKIVNHSTLMHSPCDKKLELNNMRTREMVIKANKMIAKERTITMKYMYCTIDSKIVNRVRKFE